MFEKVRQLLDDGKSMLEDAFVIPDDDDFVAVPPGVTEEQLIEEAKQYVDAIIVEPRHEHHQNLVGVDLGSDAETDQDQNPVPAPEEKSDHDDADQNSVLSQEDQNDLNNDQQ